MSEDDKELFGKIDALFEKRAPDALLDKGLEHEDFPVLTEVIATTPAPPAELIPLGEPERRVLDRRHMDRRKGDRRGEERRLGDRRQANQPPEPPPRPLSSKEEVERLVQAMELRLADLFIRQQLRMENAVRKVIREEMGKVQDEATAKDAGTPRQE
jgi:hypothetical protein